MKTRTFSLLLSLLVMTTLTLALHGYGSVVFLWWATISGFLVWRGGW